MSEALEMGGSVNRDGTVTFAKGDESLYVRFYAESVQNAVRSTAEGTPIFEKKDFLEIRQPGERDVLKREAREGDKFRFPRHWAAYEAQQDQQTDGTPIAILYPADPHIVDMMRALNIFTIQQLAGVKDVAMQRLGMGARDKVKRARDFLEAAAGMKGSNHLQAENDELRGRITVMESQLKQLLGAGVALDAAPAKKRGRPAGVKTPAVPVSEED